jgi:glycosyltransferase involved in cell wall biosynthesis
MAKIVLVANTDWYLYNFRRSLAIFLRDQGHEVILVSPSGDYSADLQSAGFRWVTWDVGRQTAAPWLELPAINSLYKIYQREKPDLVHHHTIKPVLYGSLAARTAKIPSIVNSITGRGYIFLSEKLKASLFRPIARLLYQAAFSYSNQAVIFENDEDRRYFIDKKIVSSQKTWLVPGVGVDTQLFFPTPEPEGVPVILLSSRLLWDKGVGVLVEAARQLEKSYPARVVLVGAPDPGNPASIPEGQIRAWVKEGIIEWWGWQREMNSIYQQCAVVTLPTMYGEGVPTVLLEAASCGRPLVATNMPGCTAIVHDQVNGLLVPPGDPLALARALDKLLSDPGLRGRMGAASRQLVMEKFTIEQVNQSTLDIYQGLLSKASSAGKVI